MTSRAALLAGRSLRARLIASAAVFIVLAIGATGFVMNDLLQRFVRADAAGRLDLRIASLAESLGRPLQPEDGDLPGGPPLPPAGSGPRPRPSPAGWYWQIEINGQVVAASATLGGERLPRAEPNEARPLPPDRLTEFTGPRGQALVARSRAFALPDGTAVVTATAPADVIRAPLRDAAVTIALTLGLLGLGLVTAIFFQVRFTLRPLDRLRQTLADIRAGRLERIDAPQPLELQPLTDELNALIEHDAEVLRLARRHVANLGHGLKTPLATLSAQASRLSDEAERREWQQLTELMDRRIRHHLRRARSAAQGGAVRQRTAVLPHARDLSAMLDKFALGPGIAIALRIAPELVVAVDGEDLDEMLGNLLDNACRHACAQIEVAAQRDGRFIAITIADDGAGLEPDEIARVLKPGARLDESAPGHGFGLPITSEIAELYGGSLRLSRAVPGGVAATLRLPAPVDAPATGVR